MLEKKAKRSDSELSTATHHLSEASKAPSGSFKRRYHLSAAREAMEVSSKIESARAVLNLDAS